jgi:dTDP-4-amino-4,6-dideoxygalactose transaminase
MRLRHQLAVHAPIPLQAVGSAVAGVFRRNLHARRELEDLLRDNYRARDVVLCGSGTQALQIAIEAARAELGANLDSIIALPAFSCFDVASAAVGARASVALYDLEPESLSPSLASLEEALDAGARIVVVAPLYGIPVDWQRIERLASSHGALLIEDAAQGHGTSYRGAPLGALGAISTLSFGRGKGWTGGSGGAVLFRGFENRVAPLPDAGSVEALESAVALIAQWGLGRPALYPLPRAVPGLSLGETVFHEPRRPSAMSPSAASAILASCAQAGREAEVRRANATWLGEQLAMHPSLRKVAMAPSEAIPGYLRFPVLAPHGVDGFGKQPTVLGIAPSYPKPLASLSSLAPLIVGAREFPGATRLAAELVTLPVHSLLTTSDRDALAARIRAHG